MAGGAPGPPPAAGAQSGRVAPVPVPSRCVRWVRMDARGAGPWLLLAAALCAAAEPEPGPGPRCPSCAAGAERRLLEEAAKRQLLEKLRLRERPRLAHAVPRAAVARALRRLQAGGTRRGPAAAAEQSYEIISFAEAGGCGSPRAAGVPRRRSKEMECGTPRPGLRGCCGAGQPRAAGCWSTAGTGGPAVRPLAACG